MLRSKSCRQKVFVFKWLKLVVARILVGVLGSVHFENRSPNERLGHKLATSA